MPAEAAGERLDRFLASLPEIGSRAAAERLLEQGGALVEGGQAAKSHRLTGGERIEDGTFGTCRTCGRAIDPARLEALPYTTQCIDCKRKEERG